MKKFRVFLVTEKKFDLCITIEIFNIIKVDRSYFSEILLRIQYYVSNSRIEQLKQKCSPFQLQKYYPIDIWFLLSHYLLFSGRGEKYNKISMYYPASFYELHGKFENFGKSMHKSVNRFA